MKTRSLLILLLCFFAFNMAKAYEPETTVKKLLTTKVIYPEKAKDNLIEGSVTVTVKIADDGKVIVTDATSDNDILKQGVIDQLNKMVIEPDPAFKNNSYSITFSFNLIK